MSFSEDDYEAAAARLGVPVAAIKAVAEVEAGGATHWTIAGALRLNRPGFAGGFLV